MAWPYSAHSTPEERGERGRDFKMTGPGIGYGQPAAETTYKLVMMPPDDDPRETQTQERAFAADPVDSGASYVGLSAARKWLRTESAKDASLLCWLFREDEEEGGWVWVIGAKGGNELVSPHSLRPGRPAEP